MEAIDSLNELVLDGDGNKGRMIVLDSGSHFVYDGTKNERAKLKEFLDVIKILRSQGATPIIIHHSHRVRDGQIADYHGSFEWKRDLDYQFLITKNEENNCWLFHVKKDRDNLVESKAFQYEEETISLKEVNFEESNIDQKEYVFMKSIKKILDDIGEKINQSELLKETRSIRQTLGFGEKRSIKLFQVYAKNGFFMSERKSDQKNSIFYWVEENREKVAKVAKQNIKGEN